MADLSYRHWPFFEARHRALAEEVDAWAGAHLRETHASDVDTACRGLAREMGAAGLFRHCIPAEGEAMDVRALCLMRDILARHAALADFVFAMQGLGTGAITLFGTEAQRQRFLPPVRSGIALAAFAISEAGAGSDVAAMTLRARRVPGGWVLDGEKTWISNGGIAAHYVVFARIAGAETHAGAESEPAAMRGTRDLGAFIVPAEAPGLSIAARIEVIAPHPLATLRFSDCFVPDEALLGEPGHGFRIAMATLDIFRPTVGAAALGMARRALDEALARATARPMFGRSLAELDITQAKLADMATAIDAAALLVYRAAWTRDTTGARITREAAMAKLFATEAAQRVIDEAVQIAGALGVKSGEVVEALYREIRALRIYEGASEVQRLVIARQLLQDR